MSTQAMVSSATSIHAERMLIAEDLQESFDKVIRAPEESTSGTKSDSYVRDAAASSFLVVLLSQHSRKAVIEEVVAALQAGTHVAAFALHYPPFKATTAWAPTQEEERIRRQGIFIKEVASVVELRREVRKAIAHFISKAASRLRASTGQHAYELGIDWLASSDVRRVALVQRSSMLLLGPRASIPDEVKCLQRITLFANRAAAKNGPRADFIHVFDKESTLREAILNHDKYHHESPNRLLTESLRRPNPRVHIAGVTSKLFSTLLVDDRVALGTPMGASGVFMSVIEDRIIANEVFEMLKRNSPGGYDQAYLDEVHAALGQPNA